MSDNAAEIEIEATPAPSPAEPRRHNWRDYAQLLALACCWSSTYPLTKIGLGSIPPITFISARSLVAAAFLIAVLRIRGLRLPTGGRAWKLFALGESVPQNLALGLVLVMTGVAAMTVPGGALRRAMQRLRDR